ncbi:hypothetical protein [Brucella rhizosphaerae]|uniref:hypothetical protein n=1 Tax=Brucella rhizosphaerae TaxID=571254 RepID=UPI0004653387|nr:hypothetical protein [Brucella rhizosphaerae]
MLCNLFSSLASIKKPDNASITFLIVENNASPTLDETIEGFRAQMHEDQIDYIIEGVLVPDSKLQPCDTACHTPD